MMAAPTTLEEALRLLEELDRQIRERDLQIRELDLRIKERDQQLEDPRRLLRPTTLDEYLEECHNLVYSRFSVGPDQTTTGSIHAYEKFVPKALRRWTDFLGRQNEMMTAIYSSFPTDEPLFDHRAYLSTVGKKVAPIADEKMLEAFLRTSVEDPVRCIMNELSKSDDFLKEMDIGRGIKFGNHLKAVAEYGFEVAKEHPQQPSASPPRLPSHSEFDRLKTPDVVEDPPRLNADQICTYRYERGDAVQRSLLAISKYKPPHKLTINQLRIGLHDMDIFQDVVRQVKRKRPDDEKDFQEDAERVTAAAVVQTYHYMIKAGLSYSLLTTGEAVVFLKIDWGQPETLYYHLAEPGAEVAEHSQYRSCTAVAQYVAFHLLALRDYPKVQVRQERRLEVARQLKRWSVSFRAAADGATGSDEAPSSSPAFIPKTYSDADRTVRPRKSLRLNPGLATCKDPGTWPGNRSPEGSDDENGPRAQSPTPGKRPGTREPSSRKSRQHTGATGSNPQSGHAGRGTSRYSGKSIDEPQPPPVDLEYCTQRCLLSMVKARSADPHCPNVSLHTEGQGPDEEGKVKHAISHYEFQKLLSDQLAASLDDGIKPLNASGARGVMFKVTLLSHGYTFVAKGTTTRYIGSLRYEWGVYARMEPIQGIYVPVFLGAEDLRRFNKVYFYDIDVDVVYLIFMSWGGVSLYEAQSQGDASGQSAIEDIKHLAIRSMKAVHSQGVTHRDARRENLLYDPRTQRVTVIDFERASVLTRPTVPAKTLQPRRLEPNGSAPVKRQRIGHGDGQVKNVSSVRPDQAENEAGETEGRFKWLRQDDIAGVRLAFT